MDNFVFQRPVKTLFGRGQLENLVTEIRPYGNRILFTYGKKHLKETGVYDRIVRLLKEGGIEWKELPGVHSNPRATLVRKGIEICREHDLQFVLAVGGGSCSDTAKAVAAGVKLDGDIWQAYIDFHTRIPESEKKYLVKDALPTGVVMTKAGTGSDFDMTSVLSNWETREKLMIIYPVLFPKFAICDPELTFSLSKDQTAYGIADMMTHVFEQYFSHTSNAPAQDGMKEALLRTMISSGKIAIDKPNDYAARANLLYCASWACSQLVQLGVVNDWGSHLIEHEVTAITDLNHGLGMSIIYPAWMHYVIKKGPEKFAQYAEKVWGIERQGRSSLDVGLEGIQKTRDFWSLLGIPPTLSKAGVAPSVIPTAAQKAVRFGPIGSYRILEESDVKNILTSVS